MKKTLLLQLFLLLVTYSYSQKLQKVDFLLNTNYSYLIEKSEPPKPIVGDFGFEVGAQAQFNYRNSEKMKILIGSSFQYSNWTVTAFHRTNENRLLHFKKSVQLSYPLTPKLKINSGIWVAYLMMADYQERPTLENNDKFWFRKFPFGGTLEMDYQLNNNITITGGYSISAISIYAGDSLGSEFKKARLNLFKIGLKCQIKK